MSQDKVSKPCGPRWEHFIPSSRFLSVSFLSLQLELFQMT